MFDDFLVRALVGGLGVALVVGPFGSFVVWRRLAYFGETLAHSALLGVALGFLLEINLTLGILVICQVLAVLLYFGQKQNQLEVWRAVQSELQSVRKSSFLQLREYCFSHCHQQTSGWTFLPFFRCLQ